MKNTSYIIERSLFDVLKFFCFLLNLISFPYAGYCYIYRKSWLGLNSKVNEFELFKTWRGKESLLLKLIQLIKYYIRIIFLEKHDENVH